MFERKDYLDLSGKAAVITGAGSGIGLAVADMLSAYGAAVAIVDVNPAGEPSSPRLDISTSCTITRESPCARP